MGRSIQFLRVFLITALLTLLTQVGGVAYLLGLLVTRPLRRLSDSHWKRRAVVTAATVAIYVPASIAVVAPLADLFGRERVSCESTTVVGCALNRAYLRPQAIALIDELDQAMDHEFPGSRVTVLEGSFPFLDGFPLPPHLSHDDGRKIDIAYFYRDAASGAPIPAGSPSPVGFFHFQEPRPSEHLPCAGRLTPLRWNLAWLQPAKPAWVLDEKRTRAVIVWLKARPEVARIFIEPHLANRLGVSGGKVRFQGCQAARHDDHLHVEVR